MRRVFLTALCLCLTGACSEKELNMKAPALSTEPPSAGEKGKPSKIISIQERKIIKEGRVEFETSDTNQTHARIVGEVKRVKGYISGEDSNTRDGRIEQSMTVRVPAEHFDAFLAAVSKGVDHFDSKTINTTDVTEEYVDVEARIRTKKQLEQRYVALLERAQTVKDILDIEKQLGELRADLESLEGRIRFLKNQVSFSTLTIVFYEKTAVGGVFWSKTKAGLANGWNGFVWFVVGLINIWPIVLAGLTIAIVVYVQRRRRKPRR